ncbi:MAG: hypothetical protein AB7T31_04455 [Gemmatimonadales bacterium]
MTNRTPLLIAFAAFTLGASCGVTTPDLDQVGTVQFVGIEGGCWVIATAERIYEPINLPAELHVDGLGVTFEATERDDLASTCMVGQIIEILRIQPDAG